MAYYSLSEFRVIVLHDMATFLIDYVNRAVLWPIGIDPMLKNLAAITGYSYESHLAFFLPKGLKVSAVHKGLKHQMAKSFANGSSQRACGWWFLFLEHGVAVALAHGMWISWDGRSQPHCSAVPCVPKGDRLLSLFASLPANLCSVLFNQNISSPWPPLHG